jgi:hypothetical protein
MCNSQILKKNSILRSHWVVWDCFHFFTQRNVQKTGILSFVSAFSKIKIRGKANALYENLYGLHIVWTDSNSVRVWTALDEYTNCDGPETYDVSIVSIVCNISSHWIRRVPTIVYNT